MSSSNAVMVTIDANELGMLGKPVPVDNVVSTKDQTVFNLVSADNQFSIIGTWDQIIAFGAAIVAETYNWAFFNGQESWLTPESDNDNTEEGTDNGASGNGGTEGSEARGSGAGKQDGQEGG